MSPMKAIKKYSNDFQKDNLMNLTWSINLEKHIEKMKHPKPIAHCGYFFNYDYQDKEKEEKNESSSIDGYSERSF